ncbi:MAG: beta-propeller domain-containing protein [Candidatus Bathyarchaeia archaeon]
MIKGKVVLLTVLIGLSMFLALCSNTEYGTAALNKFRSYDELKEFLQKPRPYYPPDYAFFLPDGNARVLSESYGSYGYSKTNIQVEGVDEADIVKTDGEFLYVISGQSVVIVKAYPPEEAAVLSRINVNGTLKQLFINGDRLVIFYEGTVQTFYPEVIGKAYSGYCGEPKTFIQIYDVSFREFPTLRREIIVEGHYFNSRMIGNYVYAIVMRSACINNDEVELPKICFDGEWREIDATEIYYSNVLDYAYIYTTIVAVNVQSDWQEPTYGPLLLGATSTLYVSLSNIYLAITDHHNTYLHRIHVEDDEITYVADGQVPGVVLNQFSMDEYNGYFRIATCYGGINSLYVLNMDLEIVGSLKDVAPREQIHSARFMGDICYLVTFRKVDPFFVIDLADPYNPKVLGELKVSGYSDYLHLYDANHVIGVGKETVPEEEGDFSWYQGVKISLFDVTNVSSPEEIAKYIIGERGTHSPVLSDHKAFLFNKEKQLLVIPVLVADINESKYPQGVPPCVCGEPVWQGAYVFAVSLELEEKIVLRGTITHIENGNVMDSTHHITRALYIGDVLYTISESKVKMNSLLDLSEIKELNLKA